MDVLNKKISFKIKSKYGVTNNAKQEMEVVAAKKKQKEETKDQLNEYQSNFNKKEKRRMSFKNMEVQAMSEAAGAMKDCISVLKMIGSTDDVYIGMAENWVYDNFDFGHKTERNERLSIIDSNPKPFIRLFRTKERLGKDWTDAVLNERINDIFTRFMRR